jgi:ribosomal protein S27E
LKRKLEEFISQGRNKFYLRDFAEEAHITIIEAEDFFMPLLKKSEIEGILEVRCPSCGASLGTYRKYFDIPEKITCEFCGEEFQRSDDFLEIVLEVKGEFFRSQERSIEPYRKKTYET